MKRTNFLKNAIKVAASLAMVVSFMLPSTAVAAQSGKADDSVTSGGVEKVMTDSGYFAVANQVYVYFNYGVTQDDVADFMKQWGLSYYDGCSLDTFFGRYKAVCTACADCTLDETVKLLSTDDRVYSAELNLLSGYAADGSSNDLVQIKTGEWVVADEVVVLFNYGVTSDDVSAFMEQWGLSYYQNSTLKNLFGHPWASFTPCEDCTLEETVELLSTDSRVYSAELDYLMYAADGEACWVGPWFDEILPGSNYVPDQFVILACGSEQEVRADVEEIGGSVETWLEASDGEKLALITMPEDLHTQEAVDKLEALSSISAAQPNQVYSSESAAGTRGNFENQFELYTHWANAKCGSDYVASTLSIVYSSGATDSVINGMAKLLGAKIVDIADIGASRIATVELPDGMGIFEGMMKLYPNMQMAGPEVLLSASSTVNDARAAEQWYLDTINAYAAWDYSKSSHAVGVAVLDSGVNYAHSDLLANASASLGYNVVDNSTDVSDSVGHGTSVAGCIAACANNEIGIAGVSYNANIVPIKMADASEGVPLQNFTNAIEYATEYLSDTNVKIINMSYETTTYTPAMETAVNGAVASGFAFVCAAGNLRDGQSITDAKYPSDFDASISVVATQSDNTICEFSNQGAAKDIAAPGSDILTTVASSDYTTCSGTSFAAPIVSGVLALMYSYDPYLTVDQAKDILYRSATDLGDEGRDSVYGWGLVNASAAMQLLVDTYPQGTWKRLAGSTRYETSKVISQTGWQRGSSSEVVLANGSTFPDALSGSALAGIYDCPVILTDSSTLSDEALYEINRLGATHVTILGGTSAISSDAQAEIEERLGEGTTTRLSGATRYATNDAILAAGSGNWASTAIVVTGESCADALSVSAYAYAAQCPILMCNANGELTSAAWSAINSSAITDVVVVGGTSAVPASVTTQIASALGSNHVVRLAGASRYDTSSAIATWETGNNATAAVQPLVTLSYDECAVASGENANFPDALSGASLAGHKGSVLMLVSPNDSTGGACVTTNIASLADNDIVRGYILGGTAAVPAATQQLLESYV